MFFQNMHVFLKIFTFVTTPLQVSKDCDFFLNKNDIVSNFVELINEWFCVKDIRCMEKMVQLSTLHIWINSHIFQKHYNFHEIMLYSHYPSRKLSR